MELKKFVSTALIELIDGVVEAQKHAESNRALITPGWDTKVTRLSGNVEDHDFLWEPHMVEFDIAVTTGDVTGGTAEAGLFVGAFSIGSQVKGETTNQTLSRIKFSIPVYFPSQIREKE